VLSRTLRESGAGGAALEAMTGPMTRSHRCDIVVAQNSGNRRISRPAAMIPGGLGVTDSMDPPAPSPALGSREYSPEAGGRKATPLHELISAGFPVPLGFVIPPEEHLDEA